MQNNDELNRLIENFLKNVPNEQAKKSFSNLFNSSPEDRIHLLKNYEKGIKTFPIEENPNLVIINNYKRLITDPMFLSALGTYMGEFQSWHDWDTEKENYSSDINAFFSELKQTFSYFEQNQSALFEHVLSLLAVFLSDTLKQKEVIIPALANFLVALMEQSFFENTTPPFVFIPSQSLLIYALFGKLEGEDSNILINGNHLLCFQMTGQLLVFSTNKTILNKIKGIQALQEKVQSQLIQCALILAAIKIFEPDQLSVLEFFPEEINPEAFLVLFNNCLSHLKEVIATHPQLSSMNLDQKINFFKEKLNVPIIPEGIYSLLFEPEKKPEENLTSEIENQKLLKVITCLRPAIQSIPFLPIRMGAIAENFIKPAWQAWENEHPAWIQNWMNRVMEQGGNLSEEFISSLFAANSPIEKLNILDSFFSPKYPQRHTPRQGTQGIFNNPVMLDYSGALSVMRQLKIKETFLENEISKNQFMDWRNLLKALHSYTEGLPPSLMGFLQTISQKDNIRMHFEEIYQAYLLLLYNAPNILVESQKELSEDEKKRIAICVASLCDDKDNEETLFLDHKIEVTCDFNAVIGCILGKIPDITELQMLFREEEKEESLAWFTKFHEFSREKPDFLLFYKDGIAIFRDSEQADYIIRFPHAVHPAWHFLNTLILVQTQYPDVGDFPHTLCDFSEVFQLDHPTVEDIAKVVQRSKQNGKTTLPMEVFEIFCYLNVEEWWECLTDVGTRGTFTDSTSGVTIRRSGNNFIETNLSNHVLEKVRYFWQNGGDNAVRFLRGFVNTVTLAVAWGNWLNDEYRESLTHLEDWINRLKHPDQAVFLEEIQLDKEKLDNFLWHKFEEERKVTLPENVWNVLCSFFSECERQRLFPKLFSARLKDGFYERELHYNSKNLYEIVFACVENNFLGYPIEIDLKTDLQAFLKQLEWVKEDKEGCMYLEPDLIILWDNQKNVRWFCKSENKFTAFLKTINEFEYRNAYTLMAQEEFHAKLTEIGISQNRVEALENLIKLFNSLSEETCIVFSEFASIILQAQHVEAKFEEIYHQLLDEIETVINSRSDCYFESNDAMENKAAEKEAVFSLLVTSFIDAERLNGNNGEEVINDSENDIRYFAELDEAVLKAFFHKEPDVLNWMLAYHRVVNVPYEIISPLFYKGGIGIFYNYDEKFTDITHLPNVQYNVPVWNFLKKLLLITSYYPKFLSCFSCPSVDRLRSLSEIFQLDNPPLEKIKEIIQKIQPISVPQQRLFRDVGNPNWGRNSQDVITGPSFFKKPTPLPGISLGAPVNRSSDVSKQITVPLEHFEAFCYLDLKKRGEHLRGLGIHKQVGSKQPISVNPSTPELERVYNFCQNQGNMAAVIFLKALIETVILAACWENLLEDEHKHLLENLQKWINKLRCTDDNISLKEIQLDKEKLEKFLWFIFQEKWGVRVPPRVWEMLRLHFCAKVTGFPLDEDQVGSRQLGCDPKKLHEIVSACVEKDSYPLGKIQLQLLLKKLSRRKEDRVGCIFFEDENVVFFWADSREVSYIQLPGKESKLTPFFQNLPQETLKIEPIQDENLPNPTKKVDSGVESIIIDGDSETSSENSFFVPPSCEASKENFEAYCYLWEKYGMVTELRETGPDGVFEIDETIVRRHASGKLTISSREKGIDLKDFKEVCVFFDQNKGSREILLFGMDVKVLANAWVDGFQDERQAWFVRQVIQEIELLVSQFSMSEKRAQNSKLIKEIEARSSTLIENIVGNSSFGTLGKNWAGMSQENLRKEISNLAPQIGKYPSTQPQDYESSDDMEIEEKTDSLMPKC